MEKIIEITMTKDKAKVHIENASKDEVALAICEGVFTVCKDLKIPVSLITHTLDATDKEVSREEAEKEKAADKTACVDKDIDELVDMMKLKNVASGKAMAAAAILAILKSSNR